MFVKMGGAHHSTVLERGCEPLASRRESGVQTLTRVTVIMPMTAGRNLATSFVSTF